MYRNIFSKYIITFMIIVLISFTLLTLIVSSLINDYVYDIKKDSMENTAHSIYSTINSMMSATRLPIYNIIAMDKGYIVDMLNHNADNNDAVIFITDGDGKVLVSSDNANGIIPESVSNYLVEGYISEDYLNSDLGGIFKEEHINIIRPVNIIPNGHVDYNAQTNAGAIFICAKKNNPIFERLGGSFMMTLLWIFLSSLLAIYFVSERISRPLKEMSYAAKSFAKGKFDVRVPVRGNDEVAELATAFNNMAGSLEKLEENRSVFLSNVSHDLRTPMTTISGFIDGILTGAIPPDKTNHYLEIVASEVRRLARLVNQLLDITRLESGERKINKASFDICELSRQILISCESRIDSKNLDVTFECDNDNMLVIGDKDAIHQVLYNLVDNAIKFSYEKGELTVKIHSSDKSTVVSIRNTGKGISSADLPHVFERFYKSDRSRGLDKTGLGLGLYISKAIIDQHGEEMWVKSEEGAWCEFAFTLAKK